MSLDTMLQDFGKANGEGKWDMFEEAAERMITAEKAIVEKDRTIATLQAQLAEAQEIIKSIEWGAVDNWGASCPDCGNYRKQNNGQHVSNCKLAAWLEKHPQP